MLHHILAATAPLLSTYTKHSHDVPLTTSEALSGIFGSISVCCWVFLLVPQLIENYRNQSAEAISLAFIVVWFIGDVANLLGALWAGLIPSVIAIAVWFCISDGLLITQFLYYGIRSKRREGRTLLESVKETVVENEREAQRKLSLSRPRSSVDSEISVGEIEPLLARRHSRHESVITIPGSADPKAIREQIKRRRSSAASAENAQANGSSSLDSASTVAGTARENLSKILEEPETSSPQTSLLGRILKDLLAILAIATIGTLAWFIAYKTGGWTPVPPPSHHGDDPSEPSGGDTAMAPGAQFLGYLSAVAYLGARLPQIWKNYCDKSCEGLSLLFFVLSLLGNATYGAGILCHSLQKQYVLRNLPWLIGSLGTMAEDAVIFVQFRIYINNVDMQDTENEAATGDAAVI